MKPRNGHPAAAVYSVKFYIRGIGQPLYYRVPQEEWDRLGEFFNDLGWGESKAQAKSFVAFRMLEESVDILIRTSFIQLVQFLADPALTEVEDGESIARDWQVRLYLRDRKDPFESLLDDPSSATALFVRLDADPQAAGRTLTFVDVDGEEVDVLVDEIVAAEIVFDSRDGEKDDSPEEGSRSEEDELPF